MKAMVVYDSVFGNTEKIAQAVGAALAVEARRVGDLQPGQLAGLELLVVGSPTRGFRPTPALSAWLKSLPAGSLQGVKVAAFDTRMTQEAVDTAVFFLKYLVKAFGYATKTIAKELQRAGGELAAAEGFFVTGTEGPLVGGEPERATSWAGQLATAR